MPDILFYLPDNLYIKVSKEENRSKLVQKLLRDHYEKEEAK